MINKLPVSEIKLNPNNPRLIKDDKFKKLVQSIKDFPEMANIRPVVLNKDYIILGGNMRFRAMKAAGWKEIPVTIVDLPEDKQREFVIKDNVSGGEWDWELLANEWDTEQLDDWGLDLPKDMQEEPEIEEDEAPEVSEEAPKSKLGEIYQLGNHRVMCGDSTHKTNIELLMNGKKVDMVFTDPPYGIGYEYNQHKDVQGREYEIFCDKWFEILKSKSNFLFISTGWKYCLYWWLKKPKDCFYWLSKNKRTGGSISHFRKIEPMFIWGKPKNKYNFDYFEQTTEIETGLREQHTCPKPVSLITSIISGVNKGDTILDIFLGSGTTLIACEQTDRICYGMELDPKYVDVIRKRWAKFVHPDTWEERWEELTPAITGKEQGKNE